MTHPLEDWGSLERSVQLLLYKELADSVVIKYKKRKPVLINYGKNLTLIGVGRSAFVFKIDNTSKALKVYYPKHRYIAGVEASVYKAIHNIDYFPALYESGNHYIVIDYIEGLTLFDCLTSGIKISEKVIYEVDRALCLTRNLGLNPADVHLRNIIMTPSGKIKLIDVARFYQVTECPQWDDIKTAYYRVYTKPIFPKKLPALFLNLIANFYKVFLYKVDRKHSLARFNFKLFR